MHWTVLYFKENTKLEDLGEDYINYLVDDFGNKYLQDENAGMRFDEELEEWVEDDDYKTPDGYVEGICDWFQIGGRYLDRIKASKGLKGEPSWLNCSEKTQQTSLQLLKLRI